MIKLMIVPLPHRKTLPFLLLRLGLAVVFGYAALSSLIDPREWVGYLPSFLTQLAPTTVLLKVMALYELGLVVWLLSGVAARYAGLACALTLAGIVLFNFDLFAVSFRDVGLLFAALALASADWEA